MKVHYIAGVAYDSNVYLLEDDDPIIVDAGTGIYIDSTVDEISKVVPPKSIGRIVLTHSHYDHIGGAEALSKATGARVYLHRAEAEPIQSGDMSLTISSMFGEGVGEMDIVALEEGEEIRCGETRLQVVHSPGHSPGSIALVDKAGSSAIVGDTVFCGGGVGRWDLPGGNLEELKSSIKHLGTLGLKNIYPGHGSYAEGDAEYHLRLSTEYIQGAY
ncbi:MAG: MBL fold metallo-hydrolase [Methanobacteriota archaeon]|nr:MAG: MBL fold metallo-hydrolase [Euryarchaeota archaeon]